MSSMLHVRMDDKLKAQGNEALAAMGMSAAEAVRLLYHRIVADQAFPLELKVPNKVTQSAMNEADAVINDRKAQFDSADKMINALEK
jgi:DNA-damage-inducible protein J